MIQTASQNITKPTNIHEEIERYLQKVFENELNTRDSVLVSYNPFVIKKIAGYLSGRIKMPASIGIAGETASGKSTITMDLIDTIESFATEFNIDNANFSHIFILSRNLIFFDHCGESFFSIKLFP